MPQNFRKDMIYYSADLRRRSSQFDADSLDGDHPCENEGELRTFTYHTIILIILSYLKLE